MRLRVLLPVKVLIDEEVTKLVAEASDGSFCILPRHIDFVATLVPGLLSFQSGEEERFLAVDGGILVKQGLEVLISTANAVYGRELGELRKTVEEQFRVLGDREKKVRSVLAKLEADFARRFLEMGERGPR